MKCSELNITKYQYSSHSSEVSQLMRSKLKLNSSVYSFDFSSVSSNRLCFFFYLLTPDPTINSSISLFISVDTWLLSLLSLRPTSVLHYLSQFRYLYSFFSLNNILAISAIFGRFSHHFSFSIVNGLTLFIYFICVSLCCFLLIMMTLLHFLFHTFTLLFISFYCWMLIIEHY